MKRKFHEAAILSIKAVISFIQRYERLATELAYSEHLSARKAELERLSLICAKIATGKPETFYEALQLVWFVHLVLQVESNGHSFSLGRIDQYLYTFYEQDLSRCTIDRAQTLELIECLYLKMFTINKIRSYSHTLVVSGYPTYQNVCVGGQTLNGEDATNELSYLFLRHWRRQDSPSLTSTYGCMKTWISGFS